MKLKIKCIAIILCLCNLSLLASGCNSSDQNSVNSTRSVNVEKSMLDFSAYEDSKKMSLWAYYPSNTDEGMKALAELGVDSVLATRNHEYITENQDKVIQLVELAQKYNVKVFPYTGHLNIESNNCINQDFLFKYDNIDGVYMYDEPYMGMLNNLADRVDFFNTKFKGKKYVVALHPATVVSDPSWNEANGCDGETYEEYVYTYCAKVLNKIPNNEYRLLMGDCYPLYKNNGKMVLKASHLYNLAVLSQNAKDFNAHKNLAIQTLDHINYTVPTKESLRFQVNSLLAFGFDGYTLYTYDTRPDTEIEDNRLALWDNENGKNEKTEIYDTTKAIVDEVFAFDHVYLSFDWQGIIPIVQTTQNRDNFKGLTTFDGDIVLSLDDVDILKKVDTDNNLLCSVFKDSNNNEAFYVMNYSNPYDKTSVNLQLSFDDCNAAKVYLNGDYKEITFDNNIMNLSLKESEGAFIIPYLKK